MRPLTGAQKRGLRRVLRKSELTKEAAEIAGQSIRRTIESTLELIALGYVTVLDGNPRIVDDGPMEGGMRDALIARALTPAHRLSDAN